MDVIGPHSQHEYSSLADLLYEAGYKETRVYTPEAERTRLRSRTTLDDEVEDLYGAFGFTPNGSRTGGEHRVSHVTEPSLPLKSSSSLLRSLALSNIPSVDNSELRKRDPRIISGVNSESTWWNGGIAALGRAAKAVMDMSPPSKGAASFEEVARQVSTGVGLGLAKGGEGVRKVKSNWELDRGIRAAPQEERPPMPRFNSTPSEEASGRYPGLGLAMPLLDNDSIDTVFVISAPPPLAIEDEAYGYCSLPEDYEAQCDDDDAPYGLNFEDVGSLGSSPSRSSTEERERDRVDVYLGMGMGSESSTASSIGVGRRVMSGAVEYDDDYDSPVKASALLPEVDTAPRPVARRSSTTPEPEEQGAEPEKQEVKPPKPLLKYGDRATKLRIAKSIPALTKSSPPETWLGTFRNAVLRTTYQPIPTVPESTDSAPAPIRISPAAPAPPSLITTSPVICDSTFTEAEDLPAIPPTITVSAPTGPLSSFALRLRPSLAKLREAIGIVEKPEPIEDGVNPTLSPRLDWGAQGEQFAGWTPEKKRAPSPWGPGPKHDALGFSSTTEIDYTKSFFYKPSTPPHPSHQSPSPSGDLSQDITSSIPQMSSQTSSAIIARRQRSIKSLRAALLIPVAPPLVPPIPASFRQSRDPATPPMDAIPPPQPPVLAISSPGAWEAGLPPRELVLEGEEWDARDGGAVGEWGRKKKGKKRGLRKKTSGNSLRE